MRALVLLCINQQTKLEVLSYTNSKETIGADFKNTVHMAITNARLEEMLTGALSLSLLLDILINLSQHLNASFETLVTNMHCIVNLWNVESKMLPK